MAREPGKDKKIINPKWNSRLQISHSLHVTAGLFPRSREGTRPSAAALGPFSPRRRLPSAQPGEPTGFFAE